MGIVQPRSRIPPKTVDPVGTQPILPLSWFFAEAATVNNGVVGVHSQDYLDMARESSSQSTAAAMGRRTYSLLSCRLRPLSASSCFLERVAVELRWGKAMRIKGPVAAVLALIRLFVPASASAAPDQRRFAF